MNSARTQCFTRSQQRGIGLVGAIFFITVVWLLSAALLRTVATSAEAGSNDFQRMQALLAAEAGAQLGAHDALPPTGAAQCTVRTVSLDELNLPACQATITCRLESVGTSNFYTIQSDGQCMDGAEIAAQRTILLRLRAS